VKGLTLIEVMISVAILCITLSTAVPSVGYLIERYEAYIAVSTLARTLKRSRALALRQHVDITVCPTKDDQCSNEWSLPITIFADTNNNQIIDVDENLYFHTEISASTGYWQKKRFNSPFMKFSPEGHAFSTATTFLYCPYSAKNTLAKQVVINFQGRIRIHNYLSRSNTPYANLAPLSCYLD
jgi:type IV fimbrial biogenesis protein FimT